MSLAFIDLSAVWISALAVLPITFGVAILCRLFPLRPATRHSLWLATLLSLFIPVLLPAAPVDRVAEQLANAKSSIESFVKGDGAVGPGSTAGDKVAESPAAVGPREPIADLSAVHSSSELAGDVRLPWNAAPAEMNARSPNTRPTIDASTEAETAFADSDSPAADDSVTAGATEPTSSRLSQAGESATVVPTPPVAASPIGDAKEGLTASPNADSPQVVLTPDRVYAWLATVCDTAIGLMIAIATLPMIPLPLWLAGIGTIAGLYLFRAASFRKRMRHAVAAPPHVQAMVVSAARTIGLTAVPHTLLTDARVSPLIWAGRRPVLVIPRGLWSELDKAGRRAILFHELAHLKRRDHWVAWLEVFASLVYWWHPLVWWVRRRIHEEADLSCDAWVTWTLPQGRRAYAEALLRARQYISDGRGPTPVGGMAAAGARARTFARRLTMVMTRSVRPRTSITGFLMAAAVVGLGWLATPAFSQAAGGGAATAAPRADDEKVHVRFRAATPVDDEEDGDAEEAETTRSFYTLGGGGARSTTRGQAPRARRDDDLDRRLAALEQQIRMISEQLAQLRGGMPTPTPPGGAMGLFGGGPAMPGQPSQNVAPPVAPPVPTPGFRPVQPRAGGMGGGMTGGMAPRAGGRGGSGGMTAPAAPSAPEVAGNQVIRAYELPEGKADAFFQLMVRDDVPIPVSRSGNSITVHGTEAQHRVIEAFLKIIDGVHPSRGAMVPSNPLAAAELAAAARGNRDQAARSLAALERSLAQGKLEKASKARVEQLRALAAEEAGRAQIRNLLETARRRTDEQRSAAEALERDAEAMSRSAEELEARAESLTETAAEMMESAVEGLSTEERKSQAEQLRDQARELQKQMRELEKRARELERRRSQSESSSEQLDELANELETVLAGEASACSETTPAEFVEMSPMPAELVDIEPIAAAAPATPVPAVAPAPAAAPVPAASAAQPATPAAPAEPAAPAVPAATTTGPR